MEPETPKAFSGPGGRVLEGVGVFVQVLEAPPDGRIYHPGGRRPRYVYVLRWVTRNQRFGATIDHHTVIRQLLANTHAV
jgi:hypothetical protein